MISKPMTEKVKKHFEMRIVSESYLVESDFTEAEFMRIQQGLGTELQAHSTKKFKTKANKSYQDYLDEAGIQKKHNRYL